MESGLKKILFILRSKYGAKIRRRDDGKFVIELEVKR